MSHYDADYEIEEVERRKAYKKLVKFSISELRNFREKIGDKGVKIPVRFNEHLDDLMNWLRAENE